MKDSLNSWNLKTLFDFSQHEKLRRQPHSEEHSKQTWLYSEPEYFQALKRLRACKLGKTYYYKLFLFEEAGNPYLRISKYRKQKDY